MIAGNTAVIILAAGKGTRMHSSKAKVLHPLAGQPLISWVLQTAARLVDRNIVVVVGNQADQVKQCVAESAAVSFAYQETPRGTGHAVQCALPVLDAGIENVLILCGDVPLISESTLTSLLRLHDRADNAVTLLAVQLDNPVGYGRVITNSAGRVERIVEEAERVGAFGMHAIGIANDMPPMVSMVKEFHGPEAFLEQLPRADVVVCAAPNTVRTRQVIDAAHFAAMKDDSIFVNVSRGAIVDTEALTAAVKAGKFRGVGLDVTDPEPLPKDHPLWSFPEVLITPHMAGPSDHNRRRSFELVRTNIARFLRGENLFNVVDKQLGY